jgi:hypothetical protein
MIRSFPACDAKKAGPHVHLLRSRREALKSASTVGLVRPFVVSTQHLAAITSSKAAALAIAFGSQPELPQERSKSVGRALLRDARFNFFGGPLDGLLCDACALLRFGLRSVRVMPVPSNEIRRLSGTGDWRSRLRLLLRSYEAHLCDLLGQLDFSFHESLQFVRLVRARSRRRCNELRGRLRLRGWIRPVASRGNRTDCNDAKYPKYNCSRHLPFPTLATLAICP